MTSSTRTMLLAITCIAIAGAVATLKEHPIDKPATEPPALRLAVGRCDAPPELAAARGRSAELAALAKIARYPYAPADGLPAIDHLAEAARCFAIARDAFGQRRVALRERTWSTKMERDYRDHLVRYEHAKATKQRDQLRREVDFLLAFLNGYEGAFIDRLRRTQLESKANDNEQEER